uniref:Apoptosis antagonizing transcription factor protein n=1 Tax=Glossina morsitans morsitans TaxID=37546 RepID=D3TPU9_GLOMM
MYKKYKKEQQTVAEKVADLILYPNGNETDEETTAIEEIEKPLVAEFDDDEYQLPEDARATEFKKKNMILLSEQSVRYKGKITSRKELEADDSGDDSDEGSEQNVPASSDSNEESMSANQSKIEYENSSSEDVDDETEMGGFTEESGDDIEEETNDDSHLLNKANYETEIQKGVCVQNQLRIWERLLELRIHSQKILTKANELPKPEEMQDCLKNQQNITDILSPSLKLLNQLIELQDYFTNQFSEMKRVAKAGGKRPYPFTIDEVQSEPPLKQINQSLQERFENFRSYRNEILLKWDDRTKLLNPGTGGRKKFAEDYDIIKKIDNALTNKYMLIKKSQQLHDESLNKSENNDPVEKSEIISNPNVYDDSDFYHQQLRELIEYKASTTTSLSEVTKQFMELQKVRQKMKKKVDTRASKGRKIRYVVHKKLINFMAPHDNTSWSEESKDELYKSLFV